MILENKFSLYVPSTISGNIPALELQKAATEFVIDEMIKMFDGATITSAIGAYRLATGEIVKEPINIVSSSSSDLILFDLVCNLAKQVCQTMKQECVALEVNGKLHFIN